MKNQYTEYAKVLCRHKYYVMLECFKRKIPIRGILHDLDKFRPSFFIAYANNFYNKDGSKRSIRDVTGHYDPMGKNNNTAFKRVLFFHLKNNKHHWQYWVLSAEYNMPYSEDIIEMDETSIKEMICDWIGASKTYGTPMIMWWRAHRKDLKLHATTIERIIYYLKEWDID